MSKTILVVDDQWNIRKFVSLALTTKGYSVVEAENGEQALECLRKNSIDLIVTDWNMPVMSGREVLRKLIEHKQLSHLPFVVLSAHPRPDDLDSSEKSRLVCWLRKPCLISVMNHVVTDILNSDTILVAN